MLQTKISGKVTFVVCGPKVVDTNSNARMGDFAVEGRNVIQTPDFLAITSRGVVPHITSDVLSQHTGIGGVHVALEDFIEKAPKSTPPILNCPARKSTPLHTFTALPSSLSTLLAPRRTPAVAAPTGNTDHSIWLFTSVGFQPLSNNMYIKYVQTLKPDIAIGLSDITYGPLPGAKRMEKMGDRTSNWLDSLVSNLVTNGEKEKLNPAIFAPVLPIDFHSQSDYLNHVADELADCISGLAFYSSSLLLDIPATTAMTYLPRLSLDEPSSPHHILRQVSLGMDLFTIPFISFATDSGLALTFEFPIPSSSNSMATKISDADRIKPLAIDLSSPTHATSLTPLLPHCSCYACTSHHRAYIQHLLSAHEMLGWVLLQIHNHHTISAFFSSIRESIQNGTFEQCKELFERMYESELPVGTGQRPRARGYHFKSEGKGEPKRNKPAWGALGDGDGEDEEKDDSGDMNGDETPALVPDGNAKELEEKGFAKPVER